MHAGNVVINLAVTMDMIKQRKLIRQVAVDTQTGTEWLKLAATRLVGAGSRARARLRR